MDVSKFSRRYAVRVLTDTDIPVVYALCRENTLFYDYCPPFVTEQSIREDMVKLPPRKEAGDKYYIGYFDGARLVAVMDFIDACPNAQTAFLGFFMVEKALQGKGVGMGIVSELCAHLASCGMTAVRLGRVKGNPQSEGFWRKNSFTETGKSYETDGYTVILMERQL